MPGCIIDQLAVSVDQGNGGDQLFLVGNVDVPAGTPQDHLALLIAEDRANITAGGTIAAVSQGQLHIGNHGTFRRDRVMEHRFRASHDTGTGTGGLQQGIGLLRFGNGIHQVHILAGNVKGIGPGVFAIGDFAAVQHVAFGVFQLVTIIEVLETALVPAVGIMIHLLQHRYGASAQGPAGIVHGYIVGQGLTRTSDLLLIDLVHGLVVQVHLRQGQDARGAAHGSQQ